ncbi:MAG: 4-alpha-glucanotransferase [Clostridia bacterium]|nr:4-alpha-glucanotransferase [Clostridia bacterium]
MRKSGVLFPVASLPGKYGIGTFSKSAYEFVDRLKEAGQSYWQILPLGPTGYGDSPYQSFSTYAGNPYLIDLETLIDEGLLTKAECDACDFGKDKTYINYEKIYGSRFKILYKAYERSNILKKKDFKLFTQKHAHWLDDYAAYMAIKKSFEGKSFIEWDEDIRKRDEKTLQEYRKKYAKEIVFYQFQQYVFWKQWGKLKSYANQNGIKIIGDIPIYVAFDSADTWANPQLFQFDENNMPIAVAGCPPDAFSATGQLWGNPLYDWAYHKKTDYEWWVNRIKYCFELYDVVRVDHFRGFDAYYSIPYGHKTAQKGKWIKGPGYDIFKTLNKKLGDMEIIAEDLGYLTPSVNKLVKDTGYPGMKVLQFAFDSREESDYLPHNYDSNCVVYTGTHDNDTLTGWYQVLAKADKKLSQDYLNNHDAAPEHIAWDFIRLAMSSVAKLCIVPMQDYLELDSSARINIPSTLGGRNWQWRMSKGAFNKSLAKKMRAMTKLYGRL